MTTTLDEPEALLLEVELTAPDGQEQKALGSAMVAPERITPSAVRPADFDAFWAAKLAELAKVPENAKLVPGDSGRPGVEYWTITLDNIRGTHIHGQLARPRKGRDKLPALFNSRSGPACIRCKSRGPPAARRKVGSCSTSIAHDLPIDEPESFYQKQYAGPLKDYWAIGNDDRDT